MSDGQPPSTNHESSDDLADLRVMIEAQCVRYVDDIEWTAPRRGLVVRGRDAVRRQLLAELNAMPGARFTELRSHWAGRQRFHEYSIRFTYAGSGIDGIEFAAGAVVELECLHIATFDGQHRIERECVIETWTELTRPV